MTRPPGPDKCFSVWIYKNVNLPSGSRPPVSMFERMDAYHKEMREFIKDMNSQADLYAAKVRDILGLLVLVDFSFIAKFDPTKPQELNSSQAFKLFCNAWA